MRKQKLELTWIGKDTRPKLEPRILLEDTSKSHHAPQRVTDNDIFDNRLIFGDNLLALKALESEFTGRVKCIYIDPPYNTGSAFEHYDDGIEHSLWLSLMRDRLELLYRLLGDSGSIWVNLDDNEGHYCKVLMDEIFGRSNFVCNVIWQKKYSPANDSIWLSDSHDHILVYAKNKQIWRPNSLERSQSSDDAYKNPDNDSRGPWKAGDYTCNKSAEARPNLYYAIIHPKTGKEVWPKRTAVWRYSQETHNRHISEDRIWWGKSGTNAVPAFKRFLNDVDTGTVPMTIWEWTEVGHTQDAKKEQIALNPVDPFSTPKPESLIDRVLTIATNPGDLVLDSFAGSGTTGAVAHKMMRRWISVELGEHCHTHIIPRLKKVIDGDDEGGITEATEWKGGGGFRYFRLAPSLLEKDSFGNWIINKQFNPAMLAEAICKLEGFKYAPSETAYWQHGQASESDFIYITTQTLGREQLAHLSEELGDKRSLLVMCSAFRARDVQSFTNLTIKKIPKTVLTRCEWGKDDYSLEIKNLPAMEPTTSKLDAPTPPSSRAARKAKAKQDYPTLFDMNPTE